MAHIDERGRKTKLGSRSVFCDEKRRSAYVYVPHSRGFSSSVVIEDVELRSVHQ
jgi:hypothetical protein